MNFECLENKIGYFFNNKRLIEEAFTHPSASGDFNYERLEFLGDAVLQLAVSEKIFRELTDRKEGFLTHQRANIVCGKSLVPVAEVLSLGDYLILGNGEEKNFGRKKKSTLENITEALFGAIFEDSDYETAKQVIYRLISTDIRPNTDYKSMLQEFLQKNGETDFEYRVIDESGPSHNKEFKVAFLLHNEQVSVAVGKSKKSAEKSAAEIAYNNIVNY